MNNNEASIYKGFINLNVNPALQEDLKKLTVGELLGTYILYYNTRNDDLYYVEKEIRRRISYGMELNLREGR